MAPSSVLGPSPKARFTASRVRFSLLGMRWVLRAEGKAGIVVPQVLGHSLDALGQAADGVSDEMNFDSEFFFDTDDRDVRNPCAVE